MNRPNEERDSAGIAPLILVVEDEQHLQELIRDTLSPPYQVLVASNGEEGILTALEALPDLVISDISMPIMDGYALCSSLKADERTSHIPIILLTGRAESESRIDGFEAGADAYVTKPFLPRELLARVKNLIMLRDRLRERFKAGVVLKPGEVAIPSLDTRFLERVQTVLESHLREEQPSIDLLCREIGLSRSQIHRKLVALSGMSLGEYLRYLRLHRAKQLLEANASTVSEVAYQVGFNTVAYFSRCFRERFGKLPSEVRKQGIEKRDDPQS